MPQDAGLARETVTMHLLGADAKAKASGLGVLPGKSNYLVGSDPARWRTGVSTYDKVRYREIYSGIDLVYYGNQEGRLEHDFVVAPGADPKRIAFAFSGESRVLRSRNGDLVLSSAAGKLTLCRPTVYQTVGTQRRVIPAGFLVTEDRRVRFSIGSYSKRLPLIIDPVLVYTGVLGGSQEEDVTAVTVNSEGEAYLAGQTYSTDFPIVKAYQSTWSPSNAAPATVAFISKLSADGTKLLYSTYLGGPFSSASAVSVDKAGLIYVTGFSGPGFPMQNAYQPVFGGGNSDAFVAVLGPRGDHLIYSTFLGGEQDDYAIALAVDTSGSAYVTGTTYGGFPALHSVQGSGGPGVFVAKFSGSGVLQYSSLYGAASGSSLSIAVDPSGNAYFTGYTSGADIPTTSGSYQGTCDFPSCGWVAKLNPGGDSLAFSTYLDFANSYSSSIAVDKQGDVYVAGAGGQGLEVGGKAFQPTFGGGTRDAFVLELNGNGTELLASTYLGGKASEVAKGLALDHAGNVYVAGVTCSPDFPLKNQIKKYTGSKTYPCEYFLTTLSPNLSKIPEYSTMLYKAPYDSAGFSLALDPLRNVYVTGYAESTAGIKITPTPGALSAGTSGNPGGAQDVFVSKISLTDDLAVALSSTRAMHGGTLTYTAVVTSKGPDTGYRVRLQDSVPKGATFVSASAGAGTCSTPAEGGVGLVDCVVPHLQSGKCWTITMNVEVHAEPGYMILDTAIASSDTRDPALGNNTVTLSTLVK